MKKFEYMIKNYPFIMSSDHLNDFGADGWELVQIEDSKLHSERKYIFKREIEKGEKYIFLTQEDIKG